MNKNLISIAGYAGILVMFLFLSLINHSKSAVAATNLISNPSLETANASGLPADWLKGRWGTNTAVFSYPVAGFNGAKAAKVQLTSRTSGDAKWYFKEVPVKPSTQYTFSNAYKANISSFITVQFKLTDGSLRWTDIANPGPSVNWTSVTRTFTTPSNASAVTIFHLINRVGNLTVDDYSLIEGSTPVPRGLLTLTFDDGWKTTYDNVVPVLSSNAKLKSTFYLNSRFSFPAYINESQALNLQNLGHEIGGHTRNHVNLTGLTTSQMNTEVNGNVADLKAIGITKVETFAYPFGAYNSTVESFIRSSGFIGARTSDGGTNSSSSNRFLLARRGVNLDVSVAQAKAWIDDAVAQDRWLVLVFHHVDNSGEFYSTTPTTFKAITDYALAKNIPIAPMGDAIRRIFP